ncbi:hypothetical protein BDN67DRAFT_972550 [Paxillus ammoniavirescens]|nr:hypothetical protein BDN67DRAFT_972550 [Paxillus ammoniavirescens]
MRFVFTLSLFALLAVALPAAAVIVSSAAPATTLDPFNPGPECLPQYLPKCVF